MTNVLFVCVQNAGRSQMAQAFYEQLAPPGDEARSAGSRPASQVHPEVVDAMAEVGLDVSHRAPRKLDEADAAWADVVVTMGCGDECPFVPGRRYVDWELSDPAGGSPADVRAIRDEIRRRVAELLDEGL